ncbi:hypothetical protein EDB85DRAFT_2153622 [Lactarius pseudohatsudake]|nr:hypothetical protein EDB85DRAFT_2153622 [Lactarius pseudohatsudake]
MLPRPLGHYHWRDDELQSRGGGFSDYFLRPYYQEQVVSTFLQNLGNHPSGRRIPDISAQAVDLRLFLSGTEYVSFDTSGLAPLTANVQIVT